MNISDFKRRIKPFYLLKLASSFGVQIVSLFLIYLFSPGEYGQLALIITVAQLMYILTTGWTDPTLVNLGTREYSEKGSYKNILYYRAIIVVFCWIIVTLSFLVSRNYIIDLIREPSYYWTTYLLFLAFSLQSFFNQILYPAHKNLLQSLFDAISTVILMTVTFLFVRSVVGYVYVQFVIYVLYAIISTVFFIQYFGRDSFVFRKSEFRKTLKFSVWQILGVLGIYLTNLGVNYVYTIENVSVEAIGLYNVAYKLFSEFTPIFAICVIVIPQWIYGTKDKESLLRDIPRKTIIGVALLSLAYFAIYLILDPFLTLIGKIEYRESIFYYIYLLPAFIFMAYSQIMQLVVMTTPAFKHIQYATLFQGVLLVLSCLVLVYFWGVLGAIVAVTLAFIGKSLYLYVIYEKIAKQMILDNKNYE